MLFRVCGHSKGLTFLTGLRSFIYVRANTLVSVSLPHPQHSINIRHLAVMARDDDIYKHQPTDPQSAAHTY